MVTKTPEVIMTVWELEEDIIPNPWFWYLKLSVAMKLAATPEYHYEGLRLCNMVADKLLEI